MQLRFVHAVLVPRYVPKIMQNRSFRLLVCNEPHLIKEESLLASSGFPVVKTRVAKMVLSVGI